MDPTNDNEGVGLGDRRGGEISIAKIVATATPTSWSQAYNAGKLFAVISLTSEAQAEENTLNLLGKEALENLEAEYFALETKDLEGIKTAVKSSLEKLPENIKCSFVVGAISNNILYAFAKNGAIEIKRDGKLGVVLKAEDQLEDASGFLEDADIIILQTSQFANIISRDSLLSSIDGEPIEQIAENLAPMVHEKADGGATAIIVEYKKGKPAEELAEERVAPLETKIEQNESDFAPPLSENYAPVGQSAKRIPVSLDIFKKYIVFARDKIQNVGFSPSFDRSKRTVMTVAVILLLIFVTSIFFAVKKQGDSKNKALIAKYYAPSLKKYDEGPSLLDLNQSLARDSFYSAQKILLEGEPKFPNGSSEKKQVDDLLKKVNDSLATTANIKTVTPVEAAVSDSKLLAAELKDPNVQFATADSGDIYSLDSLGVSKNSKQIIKKNWGSNGGLGVFFGNVYVLDKTTKQVYKFVSTSSDYVKTNYFAKDTTPDVSSATSIAIDGSIWVLLHDGTVLKFTRGAGDSLSLTGLDKGFSLPTRIFTNADSNNVYILDSCNSRIVVFDKTGAYKVQYQSDLIKTAKDLEVKEKDGKLYVLSGGKVWNIDLK